MTKLNRYGYPKIESEEQYWEEHKKWKIKVNALNKIKEVYNNPMDYINKLDSVLKEGVERDLIEREYYIQKMKTIYKEIQTPENFKTDIRKGKQYIKRKAKELFKKNGTKQ